jgi:signal transduction histidine kinase
MMVDASGRLWLACGAGGVRIVEDPGAESPRIRSLTMAQGLAGNSIWSCVEDRWGRVYVGTGAGIDQVDLEHGRVIHLSQAEGLAHGVPRAAFRDRNGVLWFGMSGGLSRYVPPRPRPAQPPPLFMTGLRVAGAPNLLPESGTGDWELPQLAPNQNRIQVDFTSPGERSGARLQYQYRLEGISDDWSLPGHLRSVDFANLAPGHYHFQVRAMGAEGAVSAPPAELRFTILAPVWRRGWFLALASGSLAALMWLVYRYRLHHLLEVERIRTRIAADLHDDIGASLSRIAILSEVVKLQAQGDQPETSRFLTEIAESSRDLVDSMAEIVWSIDPRRDDLKSLLARVGQFASGALEARSIRWTLDLPQDSGRIKLSPEQRRGMFLVLKEAVNNAVKHSGCRALAVRVRLEDHKLLAEVHDDGHGLPEAAPDRGSSSSSGFRGRGLVNMRARAKEIGGRLDITTGPSGTTIRLELPKIRRGGA